MALSPGSDSTSSIANSGWFEWCKEITTYTHTRTHIIRCTNGKETDEAGSTAKGTCETVLCTAIYQIVSILD